MFFCLACTFVPCTSVYLFLHVIRFFFYVYTCSIIVCTSKAHQPAQALTYMYGTEIRTNTQTTSQYRKYIPSKQVSRLLLALHLSRKKTSCDSVCFLKKRIVCSGSRYILCDAYAVTPLISCAYVFCQRRHQTCKTNRSAAGTGIYVACALTHTHTRGRNRKLKDTVACSGRYFPLFL